MRRITRDELISMILSCSESNLCEMDLSYMDLSGLDLSHFNLNYANLDNTNLSYTILRGAKLKSANLRNAILCFAELKDANLSYSELECANLTGTNLTNANLSCANLSCANLASAKLTGADLFNIDLTAANLKHVKFAQAKNIPYIPMVCPEEGSFIGWKRIQDKIIKLQIPAKAKRCSGTSRKCRCEFAKVLGIYTIDGFKLHLPEIINTLGNINTVGNVTTTYKVGEYVYPDSFDDCRWNECSNGIHFFMNREEAITYCQPIVPIQLFSKDRYVSKGEIE